MINHLDIVGGIKAANYAAGAGAIWPNLGYPIRDSNNIFSKVLSLEMTPEQLAERGVERIAELNKDPKKNRDFSRRYSMLMLSELRMKDPEISPFKVILRFETGKPIGESLDQVA